LGKEYISLISQLGLEYSTQKTYVSHNFCEFAKRLILDGYEVTPFPISALKESLSRYHSLVNLLLESENKGWIAENIPTGVANCYGFLRNRPRSFRRKIEKKSETQELIMRMIRDPDQASKYLTNLSSIFGYPLSEFSEHEVNNILRSSIKDMFLSSDPLQATNNSGSLGLTAERLVMNFTDPSYWNSEELAYGLGFSIIQSHPFLNVYGKIEQRYLDLRKGVELDHLRVLTE
jgi:hypothetical protein